MSGPTATCGLRRGGRSGGGGTLPGLAVAGMVALAAGCGSAPSTATHAAATHTAVTNVAVTTPVATDTGATPVTSAAPVTTVATTSAPPPPAQTPQCRTADLTGSLAGPDGTAGGVDYTLKLDNSGSSACVLVGYPGVSTVAGSDGHQVGAAAYRMKGPDPVVTVQPGHGADARVSLADAGDFPSTCRATAVVGLRVYPPDNTTSLFVPRTAETCAWHKDRTLGVGPMRTS